FLLCRDSRSLLLFRPAPPTTSLSTLSLHDALPIWGGDAAHERPRVRRAAALQPGRAPHRVHERPGRDGQPVDHGRGRLEPAPDQDRKSTRLNSSHVKISYAVFCLKKKKIEFEHENM